MRALTTLQTFSHKTGKLFTGVRVNLGAGSATMEVSTPDGWDLEKTFVVSGTEVFVTKTDSTYRMVLANGAKAYLVS